MKERKGEKVAGDLSQGEPNTLHISTLTVLPLIFVEIFLQRRPFLSMVDPPGISIAFDQRQTIPLSHEIHFVFNLRNWKVTFLSTHQVPASWPRQYCRLVARTSQFYLFPRSCTLLCFVLWVCNHPVPSSTNISYPGQCLHQMWITSFIGLATMVRP